MEQKLYAVTINKYNVSTVTASGEITDKVMWATDEGLEEWVTKNTPVGGEVTTTLLEEGPVQKGQPVVHINVVSTE
jgi:hypothetical protein